jgi:hypothetical protein
MGDFPAAIRQQLDQLVDMQGEVFGRLSHVEKAIAIPTEPEQTPKPVIEPETINESEQTPEPIKTDQGGLTNAQLSKLTKIPKSTIERWKAKLQAGESLSKIRNPEANKWELSKDNLWHPKDST